MILTSSAFTVINLGERVARALTGKTAVTTTSTKRRRGKGYMVC